MDTYLVDGSSGGFLRGLPCGRLLLLLRLVLKKEEKIRIRLYGVMIYNILTFIDG